LNWIKIAFQHIQRKSEEHAMQKKIFWMAFLFVFIVLLLNVGSALAHESITVGDYTLEVGWLNEPPVVGQHNAIAVNVTTTSDEQPVGDISALTLTIAYGGQQKNLTLESLDDHSPGQFIAPLLPTVPGEYSVIFGGSLGDTAVEARPTALAPQSGWRLPDL
jgi:hypothetical protein